MSAGEKGTGPCGGLVNIESIRALTELLKEGGLGEIEYSVGDVKIRVVGRGGHSHPGFSFVGAGVSEGASSEGASPREVVTPKAEGHVVQSPMVGTVYLAPRPGAAPFVREGDAVEQGQTLMIIEAMKTMNSIAAPISGRVAEIYVANGSLVEFGSSLVRIV